jgi:NADH-quinone oxidoreductase subunit A
MPSDLSILSPWQPGVLSLILYAAMVFALIGVLLFFTRWLGEKKSSPEKQRAYECGIIPTGAAQFAYPVPFYLVAIFFLIFDVEAGFIFAWAVAFQELGWTGWLEISVFIIILLWTLFYIWKKGGLDWRKKTPGLSERPKTEF